MSFLDDIKEYSHIGGGSYGEVYRSKTTGYVIKKCKIHELNLVEIIYMKSLESKCDNYGDYIPTIRKAVIIDTNLYITMNYCGINLMIYSSQITYESRIRLIRPIMSQMARFLMWLRENKLVHMDIKCENICVQIIDGRPILKFIDFGFASIYCKHSDNYVGTHSYADPKFVSESNMHQICPAYDVFSCGITIASFISRKYINARRDFLTELNFNLRIEYLYQDINSIIGRENVTLLRRMLDLDASTRITAEELYNSPALSISDELTPPPNKKETIMPPPPLIVSSDVTKEMKNYLIANILAVCKRTKNTHLFHYTIVLFYKVCDSMPLTISNYELYGMTCLILANWILHARSNENMIQLKFIVDFVFEKKINKSNILTTMIDICEAIDWTFFSIYDFSYWDMDFSDKWFEQLYIPVNRPFCQEKILQIESFIAENSLVCPPTVEANLVCPPTVEANLEDSQKTILSILTKRLRECIDIIVAAVDVDVDNYRTPPAKKQNTAD